MCTLLVSGNSNWQFNFNCLRLESWKLKLHYYLKWWNLIRDMNLGGFQLRTSSSSRRLWDCLPPSPSVLSLTSSRSVCRSLLGLPISFPPSGHSGPPQIEDSFMRAAKWVEPEAFLLELYRVLKSGIVNHGKTSLKSIWKSVFLCKRPIFLAI